MPRPLRVSLGAAGASLVVAALISCNGWVDGGALRQQACLRQEKHDYPALARLATRTLRDVDHGAFEPVTACEDTGQPTGGLDVRVAGWSRRHAAVAYFRARGWTKQVRYPLLSPDREDVANPRGAAGSAGRRGSTVVHFYPRP